MKLEEVLAALGANRVIWIDDRFNETAEELAALLLREPESAAKCGSANISEIISRAEFDEAAAQADLAQLISDMTPAEKRTLADVFFQQEATDTNMAGPELHDDVVLKACKLLSIKPVDQWTFKDATAKLQASCAANDEAISYIIDLNESGRNEKQGLEVLKTLRQYNSKGTAFLLTHAAAIAGEADKEAELQADLDKGKDGYAFPLCVISKERLTNAADDDAIAEALRIAMKRAGLRKSIHEVLQTLKAGVVSALESAAQRLLEIPPEQLDEFVVERGYQEGVSELHVVERAITAEVSQSVRERFAMDPNVLKSTARLRSLRAVTLAPVAGTKVHDNLDQFRRMEVFESSDLINKSFTPIACGDIFETDELEGKSSAPKRRFLLLGQPCDISLRGTQDRDQEFAVLIPLKKRDGAAGGTEDKIKLRSLPFKLNGEQWACDFRETTSVRLNLLDLASFRDDGRVRFDENQPTAVPLLAALRGVIEQRVKAPKDAISASSAAGLPALQLCLRSKGAFSSICDGLLVTKETKDIDGVKTVLPKRMTWGIKRTGRIRMPYAAALLRDFLSVQGRDAFDLDFTKDSPPSNGPSCAPAAACG